MTYLQLIFVVDSQHIQIENVSHLNNVILKQRNRLRVCFFRKIQEIIYLCCLLIFEKQIYIKLVFLECSKHFLNKKNHHDIKL